MWGFRVRSPGGSLETTLVREEWVFLGGKLYETKYINFNTSYEVSGSCFSFIYWITKDSTHRPQKPEIPGSIPGYETNEQYTKTDG